MAKLERERGIEKMRERGIEKRRQLGIEERRKRGVEEMGSVESKRWGAWSREDAGA
jgi:hypothetical protein